MDIVVARIKKSVSFVDYDSDEDYSPPITPNSNPNTTISTEPKMGILKKKIRK